MRAFIAWQCSDGGPDPLPRWQRYCGSGSSVLIGATFALQLDPWGNLCMKAGHGSVAERALGAGEGGA